MTKNLNYTTGSSWCYADNSTNCDTYGRLYDWATAVNVATCPTGWHLPSDAEYTTLEGTIGSLRDTWLDPSGWAGLYGGCRISGNFYALSSYGYWWSSTPGSTNAWYRNLDSSWSLVDRETEDQGYGYSVRCLKD